jgi:hypothetical protein
VAVLAAAAAAVTCIGLVDPDEPGHYPTCPFLWATGLYCPGCGSMRMIHALVHGDVARAFGLNPLAFTLLPVIGRLWILWVVGAVRGVPLRTPTVRPAVAGLLGVLLVVYWIVRNLPFGRALAP